MTKLVLKAEGISKMYRLGAMGAGSLKQDLLNLLRRSKISQEEFWALRDVSFEAHVGDIIGIIGKNGSGKSTLLKILSRVTNPSAGLVRGIGKTSSLLEVGTGFHSELSGRDNIFLNGQILGLSRKQVAERLEEIIDFSGVGDFLETPVKRYSSGMYVRLAFAVAAHLQSDILIVDEVLAVGDGEFQMKCIEKMKSISREDGKTVLFVSHNMQVLRKLCNKAMFLNKGSLMSIGKADEVINDYLKYEMSHSMCQHFEDQMLAPGNQYVKVRHVELCPEYLPGMDVIDVRTPLTIDFEFWYLDSPDKRLTVSLAVFNLWGDCILEVNSKPAQLRNGLVRGSCTIPGNFLNDASYSLTIAFIENNSIIRYAYESCLLFDVLNHLEEDEWGGNWIGYVRPKFEVTLSPQF